MEQKVNVSGFKKHPITSQQCLEFDAAYVTDIYSDKEHFKYVYYTNEHLIVVLTKIPDGETVTIEYETGR